MLVVVVVVVVVSSGELLAESCHLGVAHPPGYPTFTLLAALAGATANALGLAGASLPLFSTASVVVSPAVAANALFALIAATVPLFIAGAVVALGSGSGVPPAVLKACGLVAGVLYALSPLTWTYSTGSEVFSLNNAFVAALCWLVATYDQDTRALARTLLAKHAYMG